MNINSSQKQNDIKITVIVPVYNTPFELMDVFFDSLKKQTDQNFSVIIVDDGSSKEYKEYLKNVSSKFNSASIIFNDHMGVSYARNTGIQQAITEFVSFADSDDVVDKHFIETANYYVKVYDPDIIFGNMRYVPIDRGIKQSENIVDVFQGKQIVEIKKSLLNIQPRQLTYQVAGSPWAKIIRTKIAEKVLFNSEISIFEDQIFNREFLDFSEKIVVVPDVWYYYVQYDSSSIHRAFKNGYYQSSIPYLKRSHELDKKENAEIRNGMRKNYLKMFYASVNIDLLERGLRYKDTVSEIEKMLENETICDAINNIDVKSLNMVDRLNVRLLRKRLYFPFLLEKKVLFMLKNRVK